MSRLRARDAVVLMEQDGGITSLVDSFGYPDGAVGGNWTGPGDLQILSKIAHLVPVEGNELLTDPDLEMNNL